MLSHQTVATNHVLFESQSTSEVLFLTSSSGLVSLFYNLAGSFLNAAGEENYDSDVQSFVAVWA